MVVASHSPLVPFMTRCFPAPLALLAVALLTSACQSRTPPAITDKQWSLQELEGQPLDSAARFKPPTLMLASAGSQVSGYAGCNRMAGSYTLRPGTLEFGPLAMTRMACPAMDLETRFSAMMGAVRQYRVEENQLVLLADGRVLARFDPAPAE
jgi:heat shock protein HslJ